VLQPKRITLCRYRRGARQSSAICSLPVAKRRVFLECLAGSHMAEAARRGLTEPRDIYPLADSLKLLAYDRI